MALVDGGKNRQVDEVEGSLLQGRANRSRKKWFRENRKVSGSPPDEFSSSAPFPRYM